ncbi:MAG: exosortase/archaeosortase family protein [Candidatus Omnitrophica bacterium]|nr:exosortase/archaeosortase family protein [Candidatus Omnitrophota bacterium]
MKWLIPIGLIGYSYYPTFVWMVDRWSAKDSYFGHGFLIPLVTLYWIFQKRKALASAIFPSPPRLPFPPEDGSARSLAEGERMKERGEFWGFLVVLAGGFLQIASSVLRIYFVSAISFVILLLGSVWFAFGRKALRETWFPIAFLFLMVPLPLLTISEVTLKMKFFVSEISVFLLNHIGIRASRMGSYIQMPHAVILIGDPCSGLRSFLAFLCLGFVFAYSEKLSMPQRTFLVLIGLPLAIFSNVIRVFSLAFLSEVYGQDFVIGPIHDASGYVVFILAFFIFMAIRRKMERVSS